MFIDDGSGGRNDDKTSIGIYIFKWIQTGIRISSSAVRFGGEYLIGEQCQLFDKLTQYTTYINS